MYIVFVCYTVYTYTYKTRLYKSDYIFDYDFF